MVMDAPERVWLDWPGANRGELVFDEPPENSWQAAQTRYVLDAPKALLKSPHVQALIDVAVASERARMAEAFLHRIDYHVTDDDDRATLRLAVSEDAMIALTRLGQEWEQVANVGTHETHVGTHKK